MRSQSKDDTQLDEARNLISILGAQILSTLKNKPAQEILGIGCAALAGVIANFSSSIIKNNNPEKKEELIDEICQKAKEFLKAIEEGKK